MPDNVKTVLSVSLRRLLRPLVKIMLREGLTYSNFVTIAQMAFVESAAKDFAGKGMKSTATSVCALTGMPLEQLKDVLVNQDQYEASEMLEATNPFHVSRKVGQWGRNGSREHPGQHNGEHDRAE